MAHGDQTTRTRLMMAGAFVGALALMATSLLFSWPAASKGATRTPEEEAAAAFDSPPGSCLSWTPPSATDIHRVDCAQPHLFEVTGNVNISAEYGSGAAQPDVQTWHDIALAKCTPGATDYLGGRLDPNGRYTVNALKPRDERWQAGDRTLRCGVQRTAPSGALLATKGSAAGQDQSNVHDPGTCFALNDQTVGDPVDCSTGHAFEVVGNADLGPAFPDTFPAKDAQDAKLEQLCTQLVATYSNNANLAERKLVLYWDTVSQESWTSGSHRADCKVGARTPDGSGMVRVTGSVRGVGQVPGASSSAPPS